MAYKDYQKKHDAYMKDIYLRFFFIMAIAAVCLNMILAGYYFYRERKLVRDERKNQLDLTVFYLERIMEEADTMASGIWTSPEVQVLLGQTGAARDYLRYRDCMTYLSRTSQNVNTVSWIDVYLADFDYLLTSSQGVFYGIEEECRDYYSKLTSETDSAVWTMDYQNHYPSHIRRTGQTVTLVKPLYSTLNGRKAGIVCLGIPVSELYRYVEQEDETEGIILEFGGTEFVPLTNGPYDNSGSRNEEEWKYFLRSWVERDSRRTAMSPRAYTVLSRQSEYEDLCVYFYYKNSIRNFNLLPVIGCMCFVILLFGCVLGVLIHVSARRISQPVRILTDGMRAVEKGDFGIQIEEERTDVFGEIFATFNLMSANLKRLVTEVLEEKDRKDEFRYRLLQSQINPHFLYNIFNNMIWMVEQKDYDRLENMVYATAGYYKAALNLGNQDICLADNLKQLQYYVLIQQERFADQFTCDISFEEEILSCSIPNLVLQPLLENAITHGAQHKEGLTRISVKGFRKGERIRFEIWDEGRGIPKDELEEIRAAMQSDAPAVSGYFALVNIARRLNLRYRGNAVLTIDSVEGEWTKVVLEIPEEV